MIQSRPFTNGAYGTRRVDPVILACIHITGNKNVIEGHPDGIAPGQTAYQEWSYASRSGSDGPSATHYVARNGDAITAIDPWRRYAWSNGDVERPDTSNAGIRKALAMRTRGYNMNEAYRLEIENVGYPGSHPVTTAQIETNAALIAAAAERDDLPINEDTIHFHWQVNGVDRQNCPTKASDRARILNGIISRANAIIQGGTDMATPVRILDDLESSVVAEILADTVFRLAPSHDAPANGPAVKGRRYDLLAFPAPGWRGLRVETGIPYEDKQPRWTMLFLPAEKLATSPKPPAADDHKARVALLERMIADEDAADQQRATRIRAIADELDN